MPCSLGFPFRPHSLAVLVATFTLGSTVVLAQIGVEEANANATLYLIAPDANETLCSLPAQGATCDEPNLVVITHGWYEREPWPEWMAMAVARRVDRRAWRCGWCDWRGQARRLRPAQAATIGRDTVGPQLGQEIIRMSAGWRHVHLVGHSAGAWVVNAAAEIVAAQSAADIHITFLDAYVPDGWDERVLGRLADRPREHRWIEHYFTRDVFNLTENRLTCAHNVDITAINPGFPGHKFPWHWYLATITGRYTTNERWSDRPVFSRTDGRIYGFARAREAGASSWAESLTLTTEGSGVRISRPDDSRN